MSQHSEPVGGGIDVVIRLRELRRLKGLSQRDVAKLSGVGEKTISSFESGNRIHAMKLTQLRKIVGVYGMTEAEFFGATAEALIGYPFTADQSLVLYDRIRKLPLSLRDRVIKQVELILDGVRLARGTT